MVSKLIFAVACVTVLSLCTTVLASGERERPERRPAIVLAAFGTTDVDALDSILNVKRRVEVAFPGYDVHLAFTSSIIRGIWHQREDDMTFRCENPSVPGEIYKIKSAMATLADIQDRGPRPILVQSLHITDGEEYENLKNVVALLGGYDTVKPHYKPFPKIGLGEPALGVGDGQQAYLDRAAVAIKPLWDDARSDGSALVLMGHGNEHLNQGVFAKFQDTLRKKYGRQIYIGTVEAEPLGEDVVEAVKASANAPKSVLLAPMMVVAGDHTHNDMAGDEDDSWASLFKADDFAVRTHMEGLGSNSSWADIYIEHLRKVEKDVVGK